MYTLPPTSLKIGAEIIRRSLKTPKISHNIEKYGNTVDQLPYVLFFLWMMNWLNVLFLMVMMKELNIYQNSKYQLKYYLVILASLTLIVLRKKKFIQIAFFYHIGIFQFQYDGRKQFGAITIYESLYNKKILYFEYHLYFL